MGSSCHSGSSGQQPVVTQQRLCAWVPATEGLEDCLWGLAAAQGEHSVPDGREGRAGEGRAACQLVGATNTRLQSGEYSTGMCSVMIHTSSVAAAV